MKKYLLLFILSLTILIFHALSTKHAIYGDGNGYYSTSQSLLLDHTLSSPKIINYLNKFQGKNSVFSRVFWDEDKNPYSIGTSLVWLPSLVIASLFSSHPFDLFHELAPGITGIILMLSGLYFLEKYLLNFFSSTVVFLTIISLFFGSNVFYYSTFEPALSHQPAFFLISFLLFWTFRLKHTRINLFSLGFLFGFVPLTRLADAVLLLPLLGHLKLKNFHLDQLIFLLLGTVAGFFPQLLSQSYYYGTIFKNFYVTENLNAWSFSPVHIIAYLFSLNKGLFVWSPLYLLGIYGLVKMGKRLMLFSLTLLWLIGSFWSASFGSAGFGQRLSFSAVPYFALGIARVYHKLSTKNVVFSSVFFIIWNTFLLYGFYFLGWKNLS